MLHDSWMLLHYSVGMLLNNHALWMVLFPGLIIVELPLYLLVFTGIFRWAYNQPQYTVNQYPSVSIVITCYGEGDAIGVTIDTLAEQLYPGSIEILAVVDGAVQNKATYLAALHGERKYKGLKNRKVRVVPKWQRGGRVSTLNAGLSVASGDIIMNVDGDTSFDNDMVMTMVSEFSSANVIA